MTNEELILNISREIKEIFDDAFIKEEKQIKDFMFIISSSLFVVSGHLYKDMIYTMEKLATEDEKEIGEENGPH